MVGGEDGGARSGGGGCERVGEGGRRVILSK